MIIRNFTTYMYTANMTYTPPPLYPDPSITVAIVAPVAGGVALLLILLLVVGLCVCCCVKRRKRSTKYFNEPGE